MKYLVNAAEMKEMDRLTSAHFNVATEVLMERAALCVAKAAREYLPVTHAERERVPRVTVFAGGGNNGADAVAAGRLLMLDGYRVRFVVLADNEHASDLLKKQVGIAERYGARMERFAEVQTEKDSLFREAMYETDIIIDGLFGIGLSRRVEGQYADAIDYINACPRAYVIAVDMPSGIHTDTGEVMGSAVKADVTVTFDYVKLGQVLYPGCDYCGSLVRESAGINVTTPEKALLTPEVFTFDAEDLPLARRYGGGNKGTFGKVLIVAGSREVSGAATLCAEAALRAGAGMVKLFSAAENKAVIQHHLPEALLTTYGVIRTQDSEETVQKATASIREKLLKDMQWSSCIVAGPGIGTERAARLILKTILEEYDKPLILDADALNLIATEDSLRTLCAAYGNGINKWIIITPHLAELARLTDKSVAACKKELLTLPKQLATDLHVTVLSKDARSVVADEHEERTYLNTSGNAGMATAGSGDVLAGVAGALVAERESPFYTASIAAFLHGVAGDAAAKERGARNMTARDIINHLKGLMT